MPFAAAMPQDAADADRLTCDIIFGIAKLRSISVVARGAALALRGQTLIAALTLAAAGRIGEARAEQGRIIAVRPEYNFRQFKDAFT